MDTPPDLAARYSRPARLLHWWVFAFVTLAYLLINLREFAGRGTPARKLMMQGHYWFGLAVLALVLPRLLHRWRNLPPAITPPIAGWETLLSKVTHLLLYAFLFVQPILGLVSVWAGGRGIGIPFTGLEIPSPLTPNHDLHEQIEGIHVWIGQAFYWVIGLHILAALWHHFVRHDDTLRRMI